MTDQEINARCAALAGVPYGHPFDAINNDDDLAKLIVKHREGSDVDLSGITEGLTNALNDTHAGLTAEERAAKVREELPQLFRRAAATAYAALPDAPQNVRVLT